MKQLLAFLAATGLASASAISLDTFLALADSNMIALPSNAPNAFVKGPGGVVGGLCVGGDYTHCQAGGNITGGDVLTFSLSAPQTLNLVLQDYFKVGDIYNVVLYDNTNTPIGNWDSSTVSLNGTVPQACWTGASGVQDNSCLNVSTGVLGAGNYSITVSDMLLSWIGSNDPFDGGGSVSPSYGPATFALQVNADSVLTPEPGTLGLLGLGGVTLGFARNRRARRLSPTGLHWS